MTNAFGGGVFITVGILFFTTVRGFPATSVSHGFAFAGLLALGTAIPIGRLADRVGAAPVLAALVAFEGAATLTYALTDSFGAFVGAAATAVIATRATFPVRNAYIARDEPGPDRVRFRALLRTVTNVGVAAGSVAAACVLGLSETEGSYSSLLILDAATFFVASLLFARLPHQPRPPIRPWRARDVLSNRPFVFAAVAEGALSIHGSLLQVAVPLWIALQTPAPHALIGALVALSAVTCILAQVPAARGTATARGAGVAARRAGFLLALACVFYALSGGRGLVFASALLIVATLARAAGEVTQAASAWGLSFSLAPIGQAGLYQSVFSLSYSAAIVVAPLIWTSVALRHDAGGWLIMALVFAAAGQLGAISAARSSPGASGVSSGEEGEPSFSGRLPATMK
jgi:hypothetical protein